MRSSLIFKAAILLMLFCTTAHAETLQEKVSGLKIVPFHYGENKLKVYGREVLVVRGQFMTPGTSWGGDVYAVLMKDGDTWQMARHETGNWESVLTTTRPHTEEDSIAVIHFMAPKETKNSADLSDLYLLRVSREGWKTSPSESVPATLELFALNADVDDLGVLYLRKVATQHTQKKYCNADSAAHHELGLPLPRGGPEYKCVDK